MEIPEFFILPLVQPGCDLIDLELIKLYTKIHSKNFSPEDRCYSWLIFLEIFPNNPNEWPDKKKANIDEYESYKELFELKEFHKVHYPLLATKEDFLPLNPDLLNIIHGDIIRTGRHLFKLPEHSIIKEIINEPEYLIFKYEYHIRRLERVLYIIASLNPGLSYMQGFNELIMPIYFTLNNSKIFLDDEVECLTFFCLHKILSSTTLSDLFTTQDKSSIILHRLKKFETILSDHVPFSFNIINKLSIHPVCYCFKWFSLLFCQDYEIPDLLFIWDILLIHFEDIVIYSFYIGASLVKHQEKFLSIDSFAQTISNLQKPINTNIQEIFKLADNWYNNDLNGNKRITENMLNLFNDASNFFKSYF